MDTKKNHWIALYLSGQYPGYYKLPNRFDVLLKIRQFDSTNFTDAMLSLLKDKCDVEFYNTLLTTFKSQHSLEEYNQLLGRLNLPKEVRVDPYTTQQAEQINIKKSIGFLTPFDENSEVKKKLFKKIIPDEWSLKTLVLETLSGKYLWKQVEEFLAKHDFYMVDLRPKDGSKEMNNANVLIELGYLLAKNTPYIIIKRSDFEIPSDLNGIPFVTEKIISASNGDTGKKVKEEFKKDLEKEITEAIEKLS